MPSNYLADGIGAALGDALATAEPLLLSGNVWYVSSATGVDGDSPLGLNRAKPLATLAQAVTNASADDIICLLAEHSEVISSTVTLSKAGLVILGEGSAAGLPTARLTANVSSGAMLNVTAARVQLRNINFPAGLASGSATGRIAIAAADCAIIGCYLVLGSLDSVAAVVVSSNSFRSERNTYISSVPPAVTTLPPMAIQTIGALTGASLLGDTYSAGVSGFGSGYAVDLSNAALTSVRVESASLLLGADIKMHASSTGYVNVGTATGGGRVRW